MKLTGRRFEVIKEEVWKGTIIGECTHSIMGFVVPVCYDSGALATMEINRLRIIDNHPGYDIVKILSDWQANQIK